MRPGQHTQRGDLLGVGRHRPMTIPIGPQQMRQHAGIAAIGLRTGHRVPIPVAAGRLRIDLKHPVAGSSHRAHHQPAPGLDCHVHRRELIGPSATGVLRQQHQQLGQPGGIVADPALRDQLTTLVDHRHLVIGLRPVNPTIDRHPTSPPPLEQNNRQDPRDRPMPALTGATPL
jgi:hypothetical protein